MSAGTAPLSLLRGRMPVTAATLISSIERATSENLPTTVEHEQCHDCGS
jgi:hypothetical protein